MPIGDWQRSGLPREKKFEEMSRIFTNKKTEKTPPGEIELALQRAKDVKP